MDKKKKGKLQPKTENKPSVARGLIGKLWLGDLDLPTTYWVYGVLASFVWAVLIVSITTAIDSDTGKSIIFYMLLYYCWVFVGIWRASDKFQGNKAWGILAKFSVIISTIPIVIRIAGA